MENHHSSIKCTKYLIFVHGPTDSKTCCLFSSHEFNESTNVTKSWVCPECYAVEAPFHSVSNSDHFIENISQNR